MNLLLAPANRAELEPRQKLLANIRWQIGLGMGMYDVCNGPAQALVYRSCQKGMDVARIRPAEHNRHARDLPPLVDFVRTD